MKRWLDVYIYVCLKYIFSKAENDCCGAGEGYVNPASPDLHGGYLALGILSALLWYSHVQQRESAV